MTKMHQKTKLIFPTEGKDGSFSLTTLQDETWPELQAQFRNHTVALPFIFSSPEICIEPLFHNAARALGIPTSAGSVYNLPLALDMVVRFKQDALVTVPDLAGTLLGALSKKDSVKIPFRLIVLVGDDISLDVCGRTSSYVPEADVVCLPNPTKQ